MNQAEELAHVDLNLSHTLQPRKAGLATRVNLRWLGVGLCALSGISYGFQAPLAKTAYANGVNVTTMLTLRFTIASLGIWALVALTRPALRQPWPKMAGLIFLGVLFVSNSLFYYMALQQMSAGTTTLLVYSFPMLVVLWSVLFFGEKLNRGRVLALALAVAGCILTVDPAVALGPGTSFSWMGALCAFGSALSNSIYIVLSGNKLGKGIPALTVVAWGTPVTALLFIAWSIFSGDFMFQMPPLAWLCCLGIGLLTAFSIGAYMAGIQIIGASRAAITSTTEPATAVLLGIILLGETASLVKIAGGALIISAIVLLSRPANK
ncbi:MAG TPA: DMT family transporter [Chloroflexia bacterium]|nr:DMT family transporter [Chloroflexia bacterium]